VLRLNKYNETIHIYKYDYINEKV